MGNFFKSTFACVAVASFFVANEVYSASRQAGRSSAVRRSSSSSNRVNLVDWLKGRKTTTPAAPATPAAQSKKPSSATPIPTVSQTPKAKPSINGSGPKKETATHTTSQTRSTASAPIVDPADLYNVNGEDSSCKSLPLSLRQQFYDHFIRVSHGKSSKEKNDLVDRFAKTIARAKKESSGNASSVTDMKGNGSTTSVKAFYRDNPGRGDSAMLRLTLDTRDSLLNNSSVIKNKQTNYGLLQMSMDRMYSYDSRTLFVYYKNLIKNDVRRAYGECGAQYQYKASQSEVLSEMREAAQCVDAYPPYVTNSSGKFSGIAQSTDASKCFGKLATICPNLNLDLGLIAPSAYFAKASRYATPKCAQVFKNLASDPNRALASATK